MKFILKLLLAPLMLVLWIVEWALTLALKASAVVCVIASALFLLSGFFYFVDGNVQNGCICLGIAFLLSPYGLHYDERGNALFGGEAHSAIYRYENAAQGANLRINGICGM